MFLLLLVSWQMAHAEGRDSLRNRIQHYNAAYFRAQARLQDFDRELDLAVASGDSGLLARSSAYQELQALRGLMEEDTEGFATEFARLKNDGSAEAKQELAAIQSEIDSLPSADRMAATTMVAEAEGIEIPALDSGAVPEAELTARTAVARAPSLLDLDIAEVNTDMRAYNDSFARSARSNGRVRPGTGPEGNMMGRDFPLNTWALTYDDGPHGQYTKEILGNLRAHGKKATFFWLAQNVTRYSGIVAGVQAAGMSVNDHSFTHADLTKANEARLHHEIVDSYDVESRVYGQRPLFFRCPYGAGMRNGRIRQIIADQNMVHVFWTVDSLDWQDKNPQSVLARVRKQMALEKRGIILFHDVHPQSVAASRMLLEYSASLDGTPNRLRWVTMPEIMDELNRRSSYSSFGQSP